MSTQQNHSKRDLGGSIAAWLHVAQQILAGEFQGADASTCESLWIGLRSIGHPSCRSALQRLAGEPYCPKTIRAKIANHVKPLA
jgi:hypothetical protein